MGVARDQPPSVVDPNLPAPEAVEHRGRRRALLFDTLI